MNSNRHDEEHMKALAQRVVQVASRVIAGEIGVIEGARELNQLGHEIADDFDADFMTFKAIDSETDHLPVGEVRRLWSRPALLEKDREIREAEDLHRRDGEEACRKLIRRYGAGG